MTYKGDFIFDYIQKIVSKERRGRALFWSLYETLHTTLYRTLGCSSRNTLCSTLQNSLDPEDLQYTAGLCARPHREGDVAMEGRCCLFSPPLRDCPELSGIELQVADSKEPQAWICQNLRSEKQKKMWNRSAT